MTTKKKATMSELAFDHTFSITGPDGIAGEITLRTHDPSSYGALGRFFGGVVVGTEAYRLDLLRRTMVNEQG